MNGTAFMEERHCIFESGKITPSFAAIWNILGIPKQKCLNFSIFIKHSNKYTTDFNWSTFLKKYSYTRSYLYSKDLIGPFNIIKSVDPYLVNPGSSVYYILAAGLSLSQENSFKICESQLFSKDKT